MPLRYTVVDAFCVPQKPFSGNPAAVCLLECDDDISDETKINIGAQINLSETAFVSKSWHKSDVQRNGNHFTIRWFTPTGEIKLCGHATLASAKVLFDEIGKGSENETTVHFETKYKGNLSATMNWDTGRIRINLPVSPVSPVTGREMVNLPQFVENLVHPFDTTIVHSVHYAPLTKYLFVRLNDDCGEKMLTDLSPNYFNLSTIEGNDSVIACGAWVMGSNGVDFCSRFFAPWLGVNEDPVCGSAHCSLMSYWSKILNRNDLIGKQCSNRGGYLYCKIDGDRVTLEGDTNVFSIGEIFL